MAGFGQLFRDVRKRHLVQVALIYLGVAWGLTEATGFLIENYALSRKLLDVVLLLLILGFPASLVIAWQHGEQGPQEVTRGEVMILTLFLVLAGIGTYRIGVGEEVAPSQSGATTPADLGQRSVAVLPFTNNTGADSLDWLGPGLSDLLTSNLAQVDDLSVVSPQRLFALLREEGREETESIPDQFALQIASRSGARVMARGSILGSADDLRIDVQLIDLDNGTVLAAERARGTDLFALADTLSTKLSGRLLGAPAGTVLAKEEGELPTRSVLALTGDLDAYREYQTDLRARWRELDPNDIGARYRLAVMYERMPGRVEEQREILQEILALDSSSAPAYHALAMIAGRAGDLPAADSLITRYEVLESDRHTASRSLGQFYEETGRFETAREHYADGGEAPGAAALALLMRTFLREDRPANGRRALQPYLGAEQPALVAEANLLIGDSYVWEGRFAEGLQSYQAAAEVASAAGPHDLYSVAVKSTLELEELLSSEHPAIFNRSIWKLIDMGRGERALDLIAAAEELHLRDADRLVPVRYYVLLYSRARALELLEMPEGAARIYEEMLERWGDASDRVPLMRDLPDRVGTPAGGAVRSR
jgi:TolB-like protein